MPSFWDMRGELAGATRGRRASSEADANGASSHAPEPPAGNGSNAPTPLTVTQLTSRIKQVLDEGLPSEIIVRGEVGSFKKHGASGHCYFNLKDDNATIDCKMWRTCAQRLRFEPQAGQELIAIGRIDVWAPRGQYSLVCERLEPVGQGAMELAFRQLVEKLRGEGLFDAERKRPIPLYPQRIAIMTSPQAAGYQDVLKVLRPFRHLELFLYPVPVQGGGAAPKIAEALDHLRRRHGDLGGFDVLLLCRGGGSAEDLWCFNEEVVARALAEMPMPTLTGIGHETDRSVADYVADVTAHTPTQAAALLAQHWRQVPDRLEQLGVILRRSARQLSRERRERLAQVRRHETFRRPVDHVNRLRQRLDEQGHVLATALRRLARQTGERLRHRAAVLQGHHPRQRVALERRRLAELSSRLHNAWGDLADAKQYRIRLTAQQLPRLAERRLERANDRICRLEVRLVAHPPARQINDARRQVAAMAQQLRGAVSKQMSRADRAICEAQLRLGREGPARELSLTRQRVQALSDRLARVRRETDQVRRTRLAALNSQLSALDPTAVLRRGYSITTLQRSGELLRSADAARPGDILLTRTADGEVRSTVGELQQGKLFE